ncbi:MAG: nitronate monooxygenase [Akkermansiaceae bacterium]|jgi:nitronate monooxygenase|tara:strand:+ start:744 stop:2183 length:1440 start_codon:yes stop_codon:yes gene_type:complete
MKLPQIIQGGMGIAISSWQLANSVASQGQLGVVSSTAIDVVMVRVLQLGDPEGYIRRAMAAFPDQALITKILDKYFIEGGKAADQTYKGRAMIGDKPNRFTEQLIMVSNFCEVYLAKEGHNGMIGINCLHKIQTPILAGIYGAMLAGVDVVIVGAGIPIEIPKVIDGLTRGEPVAFSVHVHGATKGADHKLRFDPRGIMAEDIIPPKRPLFFPIVASVTLATVMIKKSGGIVDGLIIEEPSAGGHNAPPRGKTQYNEIGEPIYGPRDDVNLEAIKALGKPFYLAGAYATPEKLQKALADGAAGVQLGTVFAFSDESGLRDDLKRNTIQECLHGKPNIYKDPVASPTGFPFQVLKVPDTLSEKEVYEDRCRVCDLGYLREAYEKENGSLGWRCRSEPLNIFVKKGGNIDETAGRKCLCNSLMANIGMGQLRKSKDENETGMVEELPLVTCGDDISTVSILATVEKPHYTATDVLNYMLAT